MEVTVGRLVSSSLLEGGLSNEQTCTSAFTGMIQRIMLVPQPKGWGMNPTYFLGAIQDMPPPSWTQFSVIDGVRICKTCVFHDSVSSASPNDEL